MAIQVPVLIVDGNLQMTAMLQRYLGSWPFLVIV
jgi:hypothetical protein